jgi:hypothetical protein
MLNLIINLFLSWILSFVRVVLDRVAAGLRRGVPLLHFCTGGLANGTLDGAVSFGPTVNRHRGSSLSYLHSSLAGEVAACQVRVRGVSRRHLFFREASTFEKQYIWHALDPSNGDCCSSHFMLVDRRGPRGEGGHRRHA